MPQITTLHYDEIHHHTLYASTNYERKFIGLGVVPAEYQPQDSYRLRAKQIHVDVDASGSLASALDATTNELSKVALLETTQVAEVNPYAVEVDENGLTASTLSSEFNQSVLTLLNIQSDLLHKAKLLQIAKTRASWIFQPEGFSAMIAQLVNEASLHFSQQSRKVLLLPEFIAGQLLSHRLPTDRSRSFMDELRDIADHFHIYIEQYPTPPANVADILLIQHDALTVFPGSEPRLRREYESPNGLTRTRQFLFSVAGYVLNGRIDQHDHIVVHVPVVMQSQPASASHDDASAIS
ncbi:hypothetical protein PVA45_07820 (plasmid) [Entomospira entomophila]|uniref:Uncharacterized protein n=1 Tax=Entomospira entomophila TaxID=2719988 RepID=A0A968GDE0_9SPIO|nr:hypothetical protein [Entomospira entomophilus]NIZ41411.1 hypothetical protein [Entomospira entomophilus]WDI36361.1 hypothetical protein PVA45_07820 [Entomospira entomophilus]